MSTGMLLLARNCYVYSSVAVPAAVRMFWSTFMKQGYGPTYWVVRLNRYCHATHDASKINPRILKVVAKYSRRLSLKA